MGQEYSFRNVLNKMTKQQIIAIGLFVVIVLTLLIFLMVLLGIQDEEFDVGDRLGDNVNSDSSIELIEGITGAELSNSSDDVEYVEVPVSTEYNESHNYTLTDFMPSGIYDFVSYGDGQSGKRIYWEIVENTAIDKGIVVRLDSCDVEGNKKLANEYLKSITKDISEYVIVYQVRVGDVPCDA